MNTTELNIPGYYIGKKTNGNEQIIKFYEKGKSPENETFYYGYYGMNGYHEVVMTKDRIREMTVEEQKIFSEKKYWNLPQQFYQSHPQDM